MMDPIKKRANARERTIESLNHPRWNFEVTKGLGVSIDWDTNPHKPYPVILFETETAHFHVPLNKREATKLRDFLSRYLGKVRKEPC